MTILGIPVARLALAAAISCMTAYALPGADDDLSDYDELATATEPAPAEPAAPADAAAALKVKLAKKLSFEFLDTDLADAVRLLEMQTGLKLTVTKGGRVPPITLKVEDMPLSTALRWLEQLTGATITPSLPYASPSL